MNQSFQNRLATVIAMAAPSNQALIIGVLYYMAVAIVLFAGFDLPGRAFVALYALPIVAYLLNALSIAVSEPKPASAPVNARTI